MLSARDLKRISKARLKDSEVLLKYKRFDGAIYLCGYSIEIALKARICKTLKWSGFPATPQEFQNYQSFKIHKLGVLLSLSGIEQKIKSNHLSDWSYVEGWRETNRYNPVGTATPQATMTMITSAKALLKVI